MGQHARSVRIVGGPLPDAVLNLFQIIGSAEIHLGLRLTGRNDVGMTIDEARQDQGAAQVGFVAVRARYLARRSQITYVGDPAVDADKRFTAPTGGGREKSP